MQHIYTTLLAFLFIAAPVLPAQRYADALPGEILERDHLIPDQDFSLGSSKVSCVVALAQYAFSSITDSRITIDDAWFENVRWDRMELTFSPADSLVSVRFLSAYADPEEAARRYAETLAWIKGRGEAAGPSRDVCTNILPDGNCLAVERHDEQADGEIIHCVSLAYGRKESILTDARLL